MIWLLTAIILGMLLIAPSSFAYAVQCKSHGKTWRLIDGKRCWADRHYSKSVLHWGPAQPTVRIVLRRPKRTVSRPIERRLPDKESTSTAPEPESISKNAVVAPDLSSALETRAEELRQEFRPVRTVVASPIPPHPIEIVPFPQPRPRVEPPPVLPPVINPQWALLLTMLLIGTAASEGRDD